MDVNQVISRIDEYIGRCNGYPLLVNVQVTEDLNLLLEHYCVPGNKIVYAGEYCSDNDGVIPWDSMLHQLADNKSRLFIKGVSPYLKLQGRDTANKVLNYFLECNISQPVVIFLLRCEGLIRVDSVSRKGRNFLNVNLPFFAVM